MSQSIHKFIVTLLVLFSCLLMGNETIAPKEFDGVIVPSKVADLGSNVPGVIFRIDVDKNDYVKRGDEIAVLDNRVEQASVRLAAEKASIQSEIALCKANLAYAQREQKRAEKAYRNKALSLHDLDMAKVKTQLEKIKLLQSKEKQTLAQSELKRATMKLEYKTIRAPFSGIIMERFKTIGEYINNEAVIRLAKLDPLHVEVIVPVDQRDTIEVGMKAKIYADEKDEKGWNATVSRVDNVMDAASGTFGVRLTLPNPEGKIPAGLRCTLKFVVPEITRISASTDTRDQTVR
ncbi:efflux RND transporter periplasmic adaptor subunit [Sulfurovum sp.]|uniref:efflux RND transporter periplasmic adaptor subunit n=1 Tax=Sulfurovum sp. TaxID=1969726 RepID=UPI0025F0B9E9|nr:efflux RND transporter periplasmic adaptor subunit [Sulfurovum sp.]